jgi:hypothetical protein
MEYETRHHEGQKRKYFIMYHIFTHNISKEDSLLYKVVCHCIWIVCLCVIPKLQSRPKAVIFYSIFDSQASTFSLHHLGRANNF